MSTKFHSNIFTGLVWFNLKTFEQAQINKTKYLKDRQFLEKNTNHNGVHRVIHLGASVRIKKQGYVKQFVIVNPTESRAQVPLLLHYIKFWRFESKFRNKF